jgi:hypothetical protein
MDQNGRTMKDESFVSAEQTEGLTENGILP